MHMNDPNHEYYILAKFGDKCVACYSQKYRLNSACIETASAFQEIEFGVGVRPNTNLFTWSLNRARGLPWRLLIPFGGQGSSDTPSTWCDYCGDIEAILA